MPFDLEKNRATVRASSLDMKIVVAVIAVGDKFHQKVEHILNGVLSVHLPIAGLILKCLWSPLPHLSPLTEHVAMRSSARFKEIDKPIVLEQADLAHQHVKLLSDHLVAGVRAALE